jgi:uncharacterized membrane protein YfcA
MFPLQFFRSKLVQFNIIVGKIISPLFLVFSVDQHYLVFLFLMLMWLIDLIATHQNRNHNQYNRQLIYKIIGMVTLAIFLAYYVVEELSNSAQISDNLGLTTLIVLCIFLYIPFM